VPLRHGVELYAALANAAPVYVGFDSSITLDTADATDGFPLAPGARVFVAVRDPSLIWLRSASSARVNAIGS
jgi:hypothetical protein